MRLKQFKIYYNDNSALIYKQLFGILQEEMAKQCYYTWNISRGWQQGPHFLLTLSTDNFFYSEQLITYICQHISQFLKHYPSTDFALESYREKQKKLAVMEGVKLDHTLVQKNNSYQQQDMDSSHLADAYENELQWLSIFSANNNIRPLLIEQRTHERSSEQIVFDLMILLATVYPPKASDDDEYDEYNGFLSYHSNFVFWHHSLPPDMAAKITHKFTADFKTRQDDFGVWFRDLENRLSNDETSSSRMAQWVREQFILFSQMAHETVIHWRSPYPKALVADKSNVSDFHKQFFYQDDGQASPFPTDFSGYRWLLNIVYKLLPMFDFSPLQRQFYNYSLFRVQQSHADAVNKLRETLYCKV